MPSSQLGAISRRSRYGPGEPSSGTRKREVGSDIKVRQQQLTSAPVQSPGQRLPGVIEPHICTGTEGRRFDVGRQRQVDLKIAVESLDAFGVTGIGGDAAATFTGQRLARQLI